MITLKKVCKYYDEDTSICLKDLEFKDGVSYALLGPSGCGKSTLLNMISGVLSLDEGEISINDVIINALSQKEKDKFRLKNIGYVFQDFKLIEEMTVLDNLKILELGKIDCSKIDEVLEEVGLTSKKKNKINTLSGGEKQRVGVARAILTNPKIILADEPTGSLNFIKGMEIVELLKKIHDKNKTIMIMVTHDDRMANKMDIVLNFEGLVDGGKND